jgi:hypothetical protein
MSSPPSAVRSISIISSRAESHDTAARDAVITRITDALGPQAVAEACAAGGALNLDGAIAYASRALG